MKTARLLTAAALSALLLTPLAALAQDQAQPAPAPTMNAAPASVAPSAPDAASPVAATIQDSAAPMGSPANPIPESSPTPAAQAGALTAGDASVVSNGPVPDTKANRARYGKPLSAAGRATNPAGN
jgi:hypothetical protein